MLHHTATVILNWERDELTQPHTDFINSWIVEPHHRQSANENETEADYNDDDDDDNAGAVATSDDFTFAPHGQRNSIFE